MTLMWNNTYINNGVVVNTEYAKIMISFEMTKTMAR